MSLYSANMKIMISAVNAASKVLSREFGEITQLQGSNNPLGIKRCIDTAYSKSSLNIQRELEKFRPEFGFSESEGKEYYWNVKPIDGRYNFTRAIPYFAVSVALVKAGEVCAVVISLPLSGEIFWSERGVGSYHYDGNGNNRLRLNSLKVFEIPVVGLIGVNSKLLKALAKIQYRVMASVDVSFAYVLSGKIDAFLFLKNNVSYSLMIKEACGSVAYVDKYCIVGNPNFVPDFVKRIEG